MRSSVHSSVAREQKPRARWSWTSRIASCCRSASLARRRSRQRGYDMVTLLDGNDDGTSASPTMLGGSSADDDYDADDHGFSSLDAAARRL